MTCKLSYITASLDTHFLSVMPPCTQHQNLINLHAFSSVTLSIVSLIHRASVTTLDQRKTEKKVFLPYNCLVGDDENDEFMLKNVVISSTDPYLELVTGVPLLPQHIFKCRREISFYDTTCGNISQRKLFPRVISSFLPEMTRNFEGLKKPKLIVLKNLRSCLPSLLRPDLTKNIF